MSTAAWLRRSCRLAPGAARERVVVARELAELPATEAILLETARRMDPASLRKVTTHLIYVLDPDGAHRRAEENYASRRLFLSSTLDGRFAVDGSLDPESGATVLAALSALAAPVAGDTRSPGQAPGGRAGRAGPPLAGRRGAARVRWGAAARHGHR